MDIDQAPVPAIIPSNPSTLQTEEISSAESISKNQADLEHESSEKEEGDGIQQRIDAHLAKTAMQGRSPIIPFLQKLKGLHCAASVITYELWQEKYLELLEKYMAGVIHSFQEQIKNVSYNLMSILASIIGRKKCLKYTKIFTNTQISLAPGLGCVSMSPPWRVRTPGKAWPFQGRDNKALPSHDH